jgi:UDP-glucose 4-epimerase
MSRIFVTGAAGFIGSNLVDRLLARGDTVVGWDNFSTGRERFLEKALAHPAFTLKRGDNLDQAALTAAMDGCSRVFHLAANADVRDGPSNPGRDIRQNTLATFHVLEAMRACGVRRIAFSSTGSVYGEAAVIPTPEDAPFPVQTSLYGASKIACEGLISAYGESYGFESHIFRFVSILGHRYTHGHVYDFFRQLLAHPDRLHILGDGTQRKSYLDVQDCVDAMLHAIGTPGEASPGAHTRIYNLGTPEYVTVNQSVGFICGALGLTPSLTYGGGSRGWIGDNPFIFLDTRRIAATGWRPAHTIEEGIVRTVRWLEANRWVYDDDPRTRNA